MGDSTDSAGLDSTDAEGDGIFSEPIDGWNFARDYNPGESQPSESDLLQPDFPPGVTFASDWPKGNVAQDFGQWNAPSFASVDTNALTNPETRDLHDIYLGGDDGFGNLHSDPLLALTVNPAETKAAATNLLGIASMEGADPEKIAPAFPILQHIYSQALLGGPSTNIELANHIRQSLINQDDLIASTGDLVGKVALPSPSQEDSEGDATSENPSVPETVSQWQAALPPALGSQVDVGQILKNSSAIRNQLTPYLNDARTVYDGLTNDAPVDNIIPLLAQKSPEDRMKIYGLAALMAQQKGQTPRNFFQQLALSIGRGTTGMQGAVSRSGQEAQAADEMSLIKDFQSGKASPEDAENFLNGEAQRGRPSREGLNFWESEINGTNTAQARQERLNDLQKQIDELQVQRELEALTNGQIDPIRPLAKGLLGKFEQGAYSAGESLPMMALAAIPYAGLPLAMGASSAEDYEQLRVARPTMPLAQARAISTITGSIRGALGKVQARTILGRLPVTGRLLDKLGARSWNYWQRAAAASGLNFAEQYGQMTLSNATPLIVDAVAQALGADIPGYDWNKELAAFKNAQPQTFFALLPYWLAGTGVISLRETGRSKEFSREVLSSMGMSPEVVNDIVDESDSAVQEEKYRAALSKVGDKGNEAAIDRMDNLVNHSKLENQSTDLQEKRSVESPNIDNYNAKEDDEDGERKDSSDASADRRHIRPEDWQNPQAHNNPRGSAEEFRQVLRGVQRGLYTQGSSGKSYEAFTRAASAEIAAVVAGRKPLFHESFLPNSDDTEEAAQKLRAILPRRVTVEVQGTHLVVYDKEQVEKIMASDPIFYGDNSQVAVWKAVYSDEIGELLGYGARTRQEGDALVEIQDADGNNVAGFRTRSRYAEEFADDRMRDYAEATGKYLTYRIKYNASP